MIDVIVLATVAAAWGVLAEFPLKYAIYYLTNEQAIAESSFVVRMGIVAACYIVITVPNDLLFPVLVMPAARINLENKVRETVSTTIMKTLIRVANSHADSLFAGSFRRVRQRAKDLVAIMSAILLGMRPEVATPQADMALMDVNHTWLQQLREVFVRMVAILFSVPICVRGFVLFVYLIYLLAWDLPYFAWVVFGGIILYATLTFWVGVVVSDLFRNKQDSYMAVTDNESPIFALLTRGTDRPLLSVFTRRKDAILAIKSYRNLRKTWKTYSADSMKAELRLLKLAIVRDLMLILTKVASVIVALHYVGEGKLDIGTAFVYWSWVGMAAEPFGKLVDLQKVLLDGLSYFERYEGIKGA